VNRIHGAEDVARLSLSEYVALRHTIAVRGTARMLVAPISCFGWAALAVGVGWDGPPTATLLPLVALVAGFESVHALHVGAERVGRYLQVYYEAESNGPHWESTAMIVGPALPGGGIDPLFSGLFLGSTLLNLSRAVVPFDLTAALGVTAVLHAAFAVRIVRARVAATRQRAVELESFEAIRSRQRSGNSE
jgi:hypothetical protein